MQATRKYRRFGRTRSCPALVAALILLLQGLIPGAAIAHRAGDELQICTSAGVRLIAVPGEAGHRDHGFGGLACEQCVMASFAAITPTAYPLTLRWVEAAPTIFVTTRAFPPRARAPPRPPSTAPPAFA